MTRKDYVKIADIIRMSSGISDRQRVAAQFAAMLKQDNANFDKARFMQACGINA